MKALSKPLSSPGRADKFPPPLMRFLRSNVASRSSKGRSRSSSLFNLRSRKNVPIETTQEPSSPKVTCIGQVRVRRRSSSSAKSNRRGSRRRRRGGGWWVKKALFCGGRVSSRRKKSPFRKWLCKWCLVFRFGYCKKVDSKEDSINEKVGDEGEDNRDLGCNRNCEEGFGELGSSASSTCPPPPPKNALILTRCRSAPYRASSLGGRFWGSPEEEKEEDKKDNEAEKEEKLESVISKDQESKVGEVLLHPPVVLTRCKSEPARTGERLVPESILSREAGGVS